MATNGSSSRDEQFMPSSATSTTHSTSAIQPSEQSSASPGSSNLGKDEVAWFFVEQYYTTLSKNPEKLHLFYGKRSQFVYGLEAEVANVSVGRPNIQERIKQLDFQDCKVRVTNVDSQASFDNIVIQVIGETSNKTGDPKKFVQTFVLAQQPSGYFVLNDILRYIDEEDDEEPAEVTQDEQAEPETQPVQETKPEPEPQPAEPVEKPAAFDAGIIDEKLEEAGATDRDTAPTNGDTVAETTASETTAPEPAEEAETVPTPEAAAQEVAEEDAKEPEKPTDPSPTPVQTRQPPPPAAAAAATPAAPTPSLPPKPMTWASRAAAAAGPRPVVPLPAKVATPATTQQPRQAAATQPAASQAPAPAQSSETAAPAALSKETNAEWQTAGGDSKRQNRPQSISGPQGEKDGTMGYVKYVTDKVKNDELRAALAQYGELVYFDINRQKNCAFVEFSTPAGYQAAAAANPHVVNGENIHVEPRRPKAGAYGGSNYTAGRGNIPNRPGRGGFDGRSGSQGGRGNFGGQGRGRGGGAPRGRNTTQAANA
ncbi:hypothetical protein GGR53DRAFT_229548 [Hypoxylon sp. FL1150]|nr:hypothetical protein GGR53DRAFT_229548 [Hypoxylon sp. FL1150]